MSFTNQMIFTMTKQRFLMILSVALIISNAITIFLLLKRPGHPPSPKEVIIERLDFSADQIAKYDDLIKGHRKFLKSSDERIMGLKNELFQKLDQDQPLEKDSLITLINKQQRTIEEAHFEHFKSIRGLCEKEQIAKFDELTKDLGTIFRPPMPPCKK